MEVDEHGESNFSAPYYVNSNDFVIEGGHVVRPLRLKQVAGIMLSTVAGVVLLAGIWIVGARLERKWRSSAVDLSDQTEEGYADHDGR